MKRMKKLASLLLAVVMVMAMGMTAMASGVTTTNTYKITINNETNVHTYVAYQIFSGDVSAEDPNKLSNVAWGDGVNTGADGFNDKLIAFFDEYGEVLARPTEAGAAVNAAEVAKLLGDISNTNKSLPSIGEKFADLMNSFLTGAGHESGAATRSDADGYQYVIDGLEAGYYLVKDQTKGELSKDAYTDFILQVVANTTVAAKDEMPTVEKKIIDDPHDPGMKLDTSNGSVGDTVNYEITTKVPEMKYFYGQYNFVITDTLSKGLTFTENTLQVKIGEDTLTGVGLTEVPDAGREKELKSERKDYYYVVTTSDESTTIKIVFLDMISYKDTSVGADIIVTYSATINENAEIGPTGNPNEVILKYSNNPNETPDSYTDDKVMGETVKDIVITYVSGVRLLKVDADGKDPLDGAVFNIQGTSIKKVHIIGEEFALKNSGVTSLDGKEYYKLTDGTYTDKAPSTIAGDNQESVLSLYVGYDASKPVGEQTLDVYYKVKVDKWVEQRDLVNTNVATDEKGIVDFKGLGEGIYTITEITAPSGYNLLKEPIVLKVICTYDMSSTLDNERAEVVSGDEKATWSGKWCWQSVYEAAGGNFESVADKDLTTVAAIVDVEDALGFIGLTVENAQGTTLPETGGIGTTIFYTLGSILVLGAVVLLVTKKRMSKEG